MIFFLCLIAAAASDAARITRGIEHSHFPNLRTVYHGNGATSYQNVEIETHKHVAVPSSYEVQSASIQENYQPDYSKFLDVPSYPVHHQSRITPIVESPDNVHYSSESIVPLNDVLIEHAKINEDIFPPYHHYEQIHNHEYHR